MAVGVIAGDALPEPDDLRDAEGRFQQILEFALIQIRITISIEKTLLRREAEARSVYWASDYF